MLRLDRHQELMHVLVRREIVGHIHADAQTEDQRKLEPFVDVARLFREVLDDHAELKALVTGLIIHAEVERKNLGDIRPGDLVTSRSQCNDARAKILVHPLDRTADRELVAQCAGVPQADHGRLRIEGTDVVVPLGGGKIEDRPLQVSVVHGLDHEAKHAEFAVERAEGHRGVVMLDIGDPLDLAERHIRQPCHPRHAGGIVEHG